MFFVRLVFVISNVHKRQKMIFQDTETGIPKNNEVAYLERIQALEQMLQMTTKYLGTIETEMRKKNELLEACNHKFNESLAMSSLLQQAIMPSECTFKMKFAQSFVFFRPKDVIGGDTLWMREREGYLYLACIDCTGHGVPGAMLTMAAHFCLNASFENTPSDNPAVLLKRFNTQFYNHFHLSNVEEGGLSHGLDIGLIIINPHRNEVRYAGTRQNLVVTNRKSAKMYKGNAGYIGNKILHLDLSHRIKVVKGDKFFMFTDGIYDQFGGQKNKKILSSRILKVLEHTHSASMEHQKEFLETILTTWQGNEDQTDDILIVGFSFE